MLRTLFAFIFLVNLFIVCAPAEGQIILNFSRTSTGGVRVVGQGSGNTTGIAYSRNWQTLNFDNDFISDFLGFGYIDADSVTGTITNSWGTSQNINRFGVRRSNDSNDDIRFRTRGRMFFWVNQPYTFTMEAIFDASTLSYDDLIAGTYIDQTVDTNTEIFGPTLINIASVTEPKSLALILGSFGLVAFIVVRRKRKLPEENAESR